MNPLHRLPLAMLALLCLHGSAADFRPPAVPLVTHDPYFSIWSPADRLTDAETVHWTGRPHRLTSLVRIDGRTFRVMGADPAGVPALKQTGLRVLPTRTIYMFEDAGVALTLTFMTPGLPDDLDLLSRPVTYLTWEVRSSDGKPHSVQACFDAAQEIAVNEPGQPVAWTRPEVAGLTTLRCGSKEQPILAKQGDDLRIDWGYLLIAATHQQQPVPVIGDAVELRAAFADAGRPADGGVGPDPAPVGTVGAIGFDFGRVGATAVARWLMLGYDDEYGIRYFDRKLRPYWRRNGADAAALLRQAAENYEALKPRCEAFDARLTADLTKAGGADYARLCALAYRQTLAGNKIVASPSGQPLMFPKENFSNGCIGTVDVLFPQSPFFLALSPELTRAMLVPVLDYAASPRWPYPYAPHDLGTYPHAEGQVYGMGGGDGDRMPVEESGNMLIMLAALTRGGVDCKWLEPYWPMLTRWADYLVKEGLDPQNQLCSADMFGHLPRNANLALKAIIGIGAYARLGERLGRPEVARKYLATARDYATQWQRLAKDDGRTRLAYDAAGSWSMKHNLIWDRILGLNLFPQSLGDAEIAWYRKVQQPYGLPVDHRTDTCLIDWALWSIALATDDADFQALFAPIHRYANETPSRVPLSDWFVTGDATMKGFRARPVVGGIYIKLLTGSGPPTRAGNPVIKGWYADPEAIVYDDAYWIYPTYSDDYGDSGQSLDMERLTPRQKLAINRQYLKQTFLDAFSSKDLVHWEKHPRVLEIRNVKWAEYALWAPSVIRANGRYYLFFGANDIQSDRESGGIGVAVADRPSGPFVDALGRPLIDKFHNGAQPIDQFVFRDDDGQHYLIYGGWRHCNIVRLSPDLLSLAPFPDGTMFKEITPEKYVEGPFMFKRGGRYYLMWSEGGWQGPDYSVAYAMADSPLGPFARIGKVLQQDPRVATGAGHHSVIPVPGSDTWYIVYHRRPLGTRNGNHREVCIDTMRFNPDGTIQPVKITFEGVAAHPLAQNITPSPEVAKPGPAPAAAPITGDLLPLTPLVPAADEQPGGWRYTTVQPAGDWFQPGFADAGWMEGRGGFGSPGTPGAVIGTPWTTPEIWLRREFELPAGPWGDVQLWLHYDEDPEIYINGVPALDLRGWTRDYSAFPLAPAARAALKPGRNLIAVRCRQTTGGQYIDAGLVTAAPTVSGARRWSAEKARQWFDRQPLPVGFNYVPANSISYTEMWMDYAFDPALIDRELALAQEVGFNCLRVVLPFVVWEAESGAFKRRFERFLSICERRGIRVMPVFFDDCVFGPITDPVFGRQPEVVGGWYANGWTPSPGHQRARDPQVRPALERYVKDIMTAHRDDPRILCWDLYNEPGNSGMGGASLPLLRDVFRWAREINPSQPLTSGIWGGPQRVGGFLELESDLITFHNYQPAKALEQEIRSLKRLGRPIICTEWLNRPRESTVESCLPVMLNERVGAIHWGLVNGRTQTDLPWGARPGATHSGPWQHDLFRPDHSPYRAAEIELFRQGIRQAAARQPGSAKD